MWTQEQATLARLSNLLITMRTLSLVFIWSCIGCAQQPELRYKMAAPEGWAVWVLSASEAEAISNFTFPNDRDARPFIEGKIRKGEYVTYKPGDQAIVIERRGKACHVKFVDGDSEGRSGWVHSDLMEVTEESAAVVARFKEAARKAADQKRAADKKAVDERLRKELAYIRSLPKLVGQGESVMVATSVDCARDLQGIIDFGRRSGTGIDFRKKMLELVTLGCGTAMEAGTPMVNAKKNGPFVTFKAYGSGKEGVALAENVRWP